MMKRTAIAIALLVAVGLAVGVPAPTDAAVSDAVIIALNSIELSRNGELTGDVVVNDPSTSATLAPGFDLKVDKGNAVTGDLYAESMSLSRGVVISGDLFVDALSDDGASFGNVFDYVPPVFQPLPLFRPATFDPTLPAPDVFVDVGQTVVLASGQYGAITIAAGGTLELSGGGYDVDSVQESATEAPCTFPCSSIVFGGPTELRVAGRFDVGQRSYIGAAPAGSCDAASGIGRDYVIYVGGTNGEPADPNSLPAAAKVGKESVLCANFYVEAGTFDLDRDSLLKGSVIALDAQLDQGAEAILDSAFNFAPVADPLTVTTVTGAAAFNLTGSDSDGDTLTFTLVSGPGVGTLTGLPASDAANPTASVPVNYSGGTDGVADAFVFMVDDGKGGTDTAIVDINPSETCTSDADCAPGFVCNVAEGICEPAALGQIIANDELFETAIDTPILLVLSAAAPDTIGDLVINIVSGPSNGTLSPVPPDPVDNGADPDRSAETTYTPNSGFSGADSFVFEACEAALPTNCDSGTIDISVQTFTPPAPPNAPDINTSTAAGASVEIDLTGRGGAAGGPDGRSCNVDSDCADGFVCVDGACEPGQ